MKRLSDYTTDTYGNLSVTPIGHGSIYFQLGDETIVTDPYSEAADYTPLPDATIILITHDHYDHYDLPAFKEIVTANTTLVVPPSVVPRLKEDGFDKQPVIVMQNGNAADYRGVMRIEAAPAYNIKREREPGMPFHPKGEGNGYILTLDNKRIYIAGDTELTPEMRQVAEIDIAFLPCMIPYTMNESEVIEAAKIIRPKILYPYHYSELDREQIQRELPGVEIK